MAGNMVKGSGARSLPTFDLWEKTEKMEIPKPEMIINGLPRGSVALLQAVTNVGKTTLALNLAISLATGREFYPLCGAGPPRKVIFIDYETPLSMFKDDVTTMSSILSEEERELLRKNFRSYCFMQQDDKQELILEHAKHQDLLVEQARTWGTDLIIIDPISLAFPSIDENDNTSVTSKIHAPLRSIVKKSGAALLFSHHVGKEKSEEGKARVGAYRSRGGSSIGGLARLILDLDNYSEMGVGLARLSCQKVKGISEPTVDMDLDLETRWFTAERKTKTAVQTKYELMLDALREHGREIKRKELFLKLGGIFKSEETLDRYLERGIESGEVIKAGHGTYRALEMVTPIGAVG